ncbi:MAG TPA: nucleotidyltransferase family protein [Chthonomonadaceae bacterium]|nr:nucleotidyltransferase family protein [Chthonomonadaceae bacterium]
MDAETAERIRALLQCKLNWLDVILGAIRHGILPLLYQNLNAVCPEAVPQATLEDLRDHFEANARRSRCLAQELLRLLALFEAHGVPAVPFKGPLLAAQIYGNVALRQGGDLDILVPRQSALVARSLLLNQGYQEKLHEDGAYAFMGPEGRACVELHWDLSKWYFPFPLAGEGLWNRLECLSFVESSVHHFAPEDLLLYLCMHGARHCWERLAWICDVAELLRAQPAMNWEWVGRQAARLGSTRILLLGLRLVKDVLGIALPAPDGLWPGTEPAVDLLAGQVRAHLFQEGSASPGIWELMERTAFHLRVRERLQDRIPYVRFCLQRAFRVNARDRALCALPSYLNGLYCLLRPLRLVIASRKPKKNCLTEIR